jgi:hypothetical protein
MGNPNQMDLDLYKTNRQDQRGCEGRLVSIFPSDSISELSAFHDLKRKQIVLNVKIMRLNEETRVNTRSGIEITT